MVIRRYCALDAEQTAKLFYQTVHSVNAKDYTNAQLDAWASNDLNLKKWDESLTKNYSLVAIMDGVLVGFGDIDTEGYLDRLFVHKDYQDQGIGGALCSKLEKQAQKTITVQASITAKPFFEKRNYKEIKKQSVERQGVYLTNYLMIKEL